jgi:hypothetical protein
MRGVCPSRPRPITTQAYTESISVGCHFGRHIGKYGKEARVGFHPSYHE